VYVYIGNKEEEEKEITARKGKKYTKNYMIFYTANLNLYKKALIKMKKH
jgi:hypothetical protein